MTDDTLRDLGKQLPTDRPDAARKDKVRASLLAAAAAPAAPSSRRWLLVGGGFAAGALAAAAAVILILRPGQTSVAPAIAPSHEAYARIESSSAAQLEHTLVPSATGTDEVVRVKAGTVRLAVPPTRAGDRVRVATGDAEIEGSGAYEVVVERDRIAAVTVTSGTATLRLAGQQQAVFLAAGQTWRATVQTADLAIRPEPTPSPNLTPNPNPTPTPSPTPTTSTPASGKAPSPIGDVDELPLKTSLVDPAPPPEPVRSPKRTSASSKTTASGAPIETELTPEPPAPTQPAPTQPEAQPAMTVEQPVAPAVNRVNETEARFRAGAAALRANRLAEAAAELGAAAAGEGPLAVDARYYQAVALIRAKRGAEAERALVQFIDKAPSSSTRRGRAAIMLAKLIADRGDAAGARAWYELAAKDADPAVSAAAKAALR